MGEQMSIYPCVMVLDVCFKHPFEAKYEEKEQTEKKRKENKAWL